MFDGHRVLEIINKRITHQIFRNVLCQEFHYSQDISQVTRFTITVANMLSFKLAALLFQLATIAAYSFTPPCYGLNGYGLNGNFEHDIAAVASQNSLRSLMDCVRMDKYSRDYGLCEDADTYGNWFTQQDIGKQYCVSPRRVISITVQKQAQAGKLCAAVGGLDVCPIDNADYFDCLCTHSIGRDHISCLAWYFEHNTHYDDYTCGSNGKRDINPFQDMQMPIAGPRLSPNLMVSYTFSCCRPTPTHARTIPFCHWPTRRAVCHVP